MLNGVGKLTATLFFLGAWGLASPAPAISPSAQLASLSPEATTALEPRDSSLEDSPSESFAVEPKGLDAASHSDVCNPTLPAKQVISSAIVIVDCGQSMGWCCLRGGESRLAIAQWALYDLLDAVPDDFPTAILSLQQEASQVWPLEPMTADDKSQLRRFAMQLKPHGASALRKGFEAAERLLQEHGDDYTEIILLTDGQQCTAEATSALAALARRQRIHFDVIGICTDGQVATELRSLADVGNGSFSAVSSSKTLTTALRSSKNRFQEVREQTASAAANCQRDLPLCRRERSVLTRQLHDAKTALSCVKSELAQCKSAEHQLEAQLMCYQSELAASTAKSTALEKELACCRQENCKLALDLSRTSVALQTTQAELSRTQSALARETEALVCCKKESCALAVENQNLERRLSHCEVSQEDLQKKLAEADKLHLGDTAKIGELEKTVSNQSTALAKSKTLAEQTQKQLDDSRFANVQLTAWLDACRTEKASAIERVLGTTREMAAMKRDCCPLPNTQPIIAPVVTAPGNNPVGGGVGGSPSGGAPGGVAGGGPTGPGGAGCVAVAWARRSTFPVESLAGVQAAWWADARFPRRKTASDWRAVHRAESQKAESCLWTIEVEGKIPVGALQPQGPFAREQYVRILEFFDEQENGNADRVAFPGFIVGEVFAVNSARVLPLIAPVLEGMQNMNLESLLEVARQSLQPEEPEARAPKDERQHYQQTIQDLDAQFANIRASTVETLSLLYDEYTGLAVLSGDRARAFVTIDFGPVLSQMFGTALQGKTLELTAAGASRDTPTGRDYQDVTMSFFNPNNTDEANVNVTFVVDVTDVRPRIVAVRPLRRSRSPLALRRV